MGRAALLLAAASLLSCSLAFSALAAKKEKVGKIYLSFDSDIRLGNENSDVEVTAFGDNTDKYYVDSVEVTNQDGSSWTRSNSPEVEVFIGIEDEELYTFSGTSSSNFKLSLTGSAERYFDKISFEKATKTDGGATIVLTVRLIFDEDADNSRATAPSSADWADSVGTGQWSSVSTSKYYQVQLLKDGSETGEIKDVHDTSYDFSGMITSAGNYSFKVRSVKSSNSSKSDWVFSDRQSFTPANTPQTSDGSGWLRAADGQRWWWRNADGTFPAAQWLAVNGLWYYFDAQGYMATGWVTLNGVSYYLDPASGAMLTNQRTPDGYWVDINGVWVPGM